MKIEIQCASDEIACADALHEWLILTLSQAGYRHEQLHEKAYHTRRRELAEKLLCHVKELLG